MRVLEVPHRSHVHAVASGRAGRRLAAAAGDRVVVWQTATGEQAAELEHTDQLYGLCFSPDGRRLATSSGRLVRVWAMPEGRLMHRFRAFRAHTECRAFSPDGAHLAAGSREGRV